MLASGNVLLARIRDFGRDLNSEIRIPRGTEVNSQYGEDKIIAKFCPEGVGRFVDIGASLPRRFSNTYLFYKRGWNGIGIDAKSNLKIFWWILRPRDIFFKGGISDGTARVFYEMERGLSSTFDRDYRDSLQEKRHRLVNKTTKIETLKLSQFLETHFDSIVPKDPVFFSIDVELHEVFVLNSNDWHRFRPRVICIEDWPLLEHQDISISSILLGQGYCLVEHCGPSNIWVHSEYLAVATDKENNSHLHQG